ncbi:unnamed protein product, partial [Laminaria digitata]
SLCVPRLAAATCYCCCCCDCCCGGGGGAPPFAVLSVFLLSGVSCVIGRLHPARACTHKRSFLPIVLCFVGEKKPPLFTPGNKASSSSGTLGTLHCLKRAWWHTRAKRSPRRHRRRRRRWPDKISVPLLAGLVVMLSSSCRRRRRAFPLVVLYLIAARASWPEAICGSSSVFL